MRHYFYVFIIALLSCVFYACEEPNTPVYGGGGSGGGSGEQPVTVYPPTAKFNYTLQQPLMVEFTNTSTENPTKIVWDFGDSSTSTQTYPKHSYSTTGTYIVTLTVSNSAGQNSCRKSITIPTPRVFVAGIQYNKVGKENMYYKAVCKDDDFFTTTWWNTAYTPLLNNKSLPYKYMFTSPVEMDGLNEDNYYTVYVYWNTKTNGDGTQILKQKMSTSTIQKYPSSITLTNDNKDTQISVLFSYK